ncbi:cbb3-type cytochrome oxidase assembly protein CcoS [Sphingobacterium faecium]|jgi:cbb3-type cytochrome oxidase maturation protein|uniref:cbb3-type cytochrome oxidase assembly protein CcoS n=1 Tax=Sphingobacterium faecium TaxID=34087 RepID=UPI0004E5FB99|nr:cbb3-type cytochrome oxidase assembly protein CcoS [Sphingobacterium faecium]UXD68237.1 cbb3-type cytochrome oxidase assembly protein CcoS [Sphingobacterium faecium]WGQ15947.1 cbb3-type cytochrome oxidase assembly protein CcoS [Sphingobacterium faecium]CDS93222.1 Cytochrome oxidase maturation protein [Sphingobacterium sp. PM2-P1-29]HCU46726.1 cbb3-type cytochrome oxidase assembly protein CcoS [Sphingobacterium sp.]
MSIIFMLIGCSVFVALLFLGAFFWANKTGQNEDTYTPSVRILFDDDVEEIDSKQEDGKSFH